MPHIPGHNADTQGGSQASGRSSGARAMGEMGADTAPQGQNITVSPGDFSSRDAYQSEARRQAGADDRWRLGAEAQSPYTANEFMSARAPGFGEQSTRIGGMQAAQINPEAMGLARSAALGEQPSRAEELLRGGFGRGMAAARAGAATGRGNAYLAQRGATNAMGDLSGRMASEAATLRAGEMATARDAWLKYDQMNQDATNRMTVDQVNSMNTLLASGWSYDEALRRISLEGKAENRLQTGMVLDDMYRRQSEDVPYDERSLFPEHLYMGRGAVSPGDTSYLDPSNDDASFYDQMTGGFTDATQGAGDKVKEWWEDKKESASGWLDWGGPSAKPDEFAETGGPGYGYSGFSTLSEAQKEDSAAANYEERVERGLAEAPEPPKKLELDPDIKGEAEKTLAESAASQEKALRIAGYINKGERIASSLYNMSEGSLGDARSARKDLMQMGASEVGNRLISSNLAGNAATGAGGALGFGIDAARIASDRGTPRQKKEAYGRSAVGAGAGAIGAIASAPLGPIGSAAIGTAASAGAQKLYDYLVG